jgi:SAM-dependent methyltransferase
MHPGATFTYSNIIERELADYREIAQACGLANIDYVLEDVRKLTFANATFDRVVTVSVIEHVFPEVGGDVQALREIRRVLEPAGQVHLTVPCKVTSGVVYVNSPVYEREAGERVFFAREYDGKSFFRLVQAAGYEAQSVAYISERPGVLALDRFEWGPWSSRWSRYALSAMRVAQERLIGRSWEPMLARRYLHVSTEPQDRLVNIAAVLSRSAC